MLSGAPATALGVKTQCWVGDAQFGGAKRLLLARPKPEAEAVLRACQAARLEEAEERIESKQAWQVRWVPTAQSRGDLF